MVNTQSLVPLVSLGLPVRNGEKYIRLTLDSLAAQTFRDYEVIISDNGSTDATPEICREYALADPRIRYTRTEENRGAAWNFCHVVDESRGQYFKWVAHDDLIAPDYLEKCVSVLNTRSEMVLCFTDQVDIDADGKTLPSLYRSHIPRDKRAAAPDPSGRFRRMIKLDYRCEEVFGLIRMDVLRKTVLIKPYTDSDRTLLVELCLHGQFVQIPEVLFFHRIHGGSSTEVFSNWRERTVWFDPAMAGKKVFPFWRQLGDYIRFIGKVTMPLRDRVMCMVWLSHWVVHLRKALVREAFQGFHAPVSVSAAERT